MAANPVARITQPLRCRISWPADSRQVWYLLGSGSITMGSYAEVRQPSLTACLREPVTARFPDASATFPLRPRPR